MRDFIFIIGASGIGKSTLAKNLFKHYRSVYVEQHMIPEFISLDGGADVVGALEEKTLWTSMVALLKNFNALGYKNVLGLDFDDWRTGQIPEVFKGRDYITLKLICSDYEQNKSQMVNRGEGLIDLELLQKSYGQIMNRPLLVNEFAVDVCGKSAAQVCAEAVDLIDNAKTLLDYEYDKPANDQFGTWVRDPEW